MNLFSIFVFEGNGGSPSFEQIHDVLTQRAKKIPLLGVRVLASTPWVYPRWTSDPTPTEEKIREVELESWAGLLTWLEAHVDDDVDPTSHPWRLVVARNVEGVPGASGTCTVVVTQHSHALADGLAWAEVASGLFGGASTSVGPGATVERIRRRDCIRELAGIPANLVRMCRPMIRLARSAPGHVPEGENSLTRFQSDLDRWIRVRPLRKDRFKVPGATVTTSALWRAAVGIEKYCYKFDLDVSGLALEVPLSVRREEGSHARNAFVVRPIDPGLGKDDRAKLGVIDAAMSDARDFARRPEAGLSVELADLLPARLVQRDVTPKVSPVSVSSYVRRGPFELLDQKCIWSGGGMGRDNTALTIRAIGYQDTVTLLVAGNAHVIGQPDVLVDFMLGA